MPASPPSRTLSPLLRPTDSLNYFVTPATFHSIGTDRNRSFVVLAKRWIVEHTLAWISRCRRLDKDFERHARKAAVFVHLAMIRHMLRRLTTPSSRTETCRKGSKQFGALRRHHQWASWTHFWLPFADKLLCLCHLSRCHLAGYHLTAPDSLVVELTGRTAR